MTDPFREARLWMLQQNKLPVAIRFLAANSLLLNIVATEDTETADVDGTTMRHNPAWTNTLSHGELCAVLLHEVLHCDLRHHVRRGGRHPLKWNIAADLAVNEWLVPLLQFCGMELPARALIGQDKLSTERYYAELPDIDDDAGGYGNMEKAVAGCGGMVRDAGDRAAQEVTWRNAVALNPYRAAISQQGDSMSRQLLTKLEAGEQEPMDWKERLRHLMAEIVQGVEDHAWARPSRRWIHQGLYLPGSVDRTMPLLVIALDTSGSMTSILPTAIGHLAQVHCELAPPRTIVLSCDNRISNVGEYAAREVLADDATTIGQGGGGTNFRPVFRWLRERGIQPTALVYVTDLECSAYPERPEFPVIWLATNNTGTSTVPFGEVLPCAL